MILGTLFFLNTLAWIAVYDLAKPSFLEVNFFDVGQGDAIFIVTPAGHQILIDGGPSSVILEKLGNEMPFFDKSIDLIILTHPDRDHLAGLIDVLRKYETDNILWTGVIKDTSEYREWLDLIKEEEAQIYIAKSGQKIKSQKVQFDILFPFESLRDQECKNVNDTSIVARLNFNENYFLLTGDISKSIERELAEKEIDIEADVLKIAHHGSKTASSLEFLKKVSPRVAVISVGENNYGHPHPEVLEKLNFFDINTLTTNFLGDIKIISDGKILKYGTAVSNFQN